MTDLQFVAWFASAIVAFVGFAFLFDAKSKREVKGLFSVTGFALAIMYFTSV